MRISRISIANYRNFENLDIETGQNILLVGGNATGKSNFINALRLVLDPSLSRRDRKLAAEDFWRGAGLVPWKGREIEISIELTDFTNSQNLAALLDSYSPGKPGYAKLTYWYGPKANVPADQSQEQDYEFRLFGGHNRTSNIDSSLYDHLSLRVVDALRNAETDLVTRRIPLKRLLELYNIDSVALHEVVTYITNANTSLASIDALKILEQDIKSRLEGLKEQVNELVPVLRLGANSANDVTNSIKLLLQENILLPLNSTSLGLANVLFLALSLLEIEKRESIVRSTGPNVFEFIILAIEEPEAHLHPHVQRLLFENFLRRSPLVLSTHSPHIASISQLDSIILFRKSRIGESRVLSTAPILQQLSSAEVADIERYLDVTRAELLFARAILFIEGNAEAFLVNPLAELVHIHLDKLGITICNIMSTDFEPYIKLVGPKGLQIPYAILTDGDQYADPESMQNLLSEDLVKKGEPDTSKSLSAIELRSELDNRNLPHHYGLRRSINILKNMVSTPILNDLEDLYANCHWSDLAHALRLHGIFINDWSFEPSLITSGYAPEILEALQECGIGPRVETLLRAQLPTVASSQKETEYWLKQIKQVQKGRFAQRLANLITKTHMPGGREVPEYIHAALKYLVDQLT